MTTTYRPPTDAPRVGGGLGERPYATVNPYTGETEAEFPFLLPEEIDGFVQRAHAAFLEWRERTPEERAAIVGRAAELMNERRDELAALATKEMGKRIEEAAGELMLSAMILDYYAKNGPRFLEPKQIQVTQGEAIVENEPIGVILAIEPWDYPFYQVVRVAGPNLVLGNTILLKHSPLNPQCALAIEQLFRDAGAPDGVYTNLFLRISDVEQVIADPRVQGVTLTGSERAGSSVASLAGKYLKKSVLELGGSDPFIVLDAEDLGATVKAATMGRMQNSGQSCIAAKRLIVPEDIYEPFVQGLNQAFSTFSPGDPADPSTTLAPLSSERAAQDLHAQIQDAIDKGATVVTGGGRPDHPGAFVEPTILTDVTPEMRAYQEELYGPVAVVYKVRDEEEAIELANTTRFGLGAAVFSSDLDRARAVADRIDAGMVWINQPTGSFPELPFGGTKRSGYGRELSELGMLEFANRRLIRAFDAKSGLPFESTVEGAEGEAGSGGSLIPLGLAASAENEDEASLRLVFPLAPDRLRAGDMAELFRCLDAIWALSAALSLPDSIAQSARIYPDGILRGIPNEQPSIDAVRYGSLLQLLIGGGVGAAVSTALALAVKVDDVIVKMSSLPDRIREAKSHSKAGTAENKAKEAEARAREARARGEEAKAKLTAYRYEAKAGALRPGTESEMHQVLATIPARRRIGKREVDLRGNALPAPDSNGVPATPEDVAGQLVQLRERVEGIAGAPEVTVQPAGDTVTAV